MNREATWPMALAVFCILALGMAVGVWAYAYQHEYDVPLSVQEPGPVQEPTGPEAVSGMSKYTDSEYGFSFWYPSSWTVETDRSMPSGLIVAGYVKSLKVSRNGQPREQITLHTSANDTRGAVFEYNIPRDTGVVSGDFWYDESAKEWIQNGKPMNTWDSRTSKFVGTIPKTMGGLPIFDQIDFVFVPLNPDYILSFIPLGANPIDDRLLINTVVNTSVTAPTSAEEQRVVVQGEKNIYVLNEF